MGYKNMEGDRCARASYDNTARLWNLDNGQPISSPLKHAHFVNRVSFSADGKLLATGCDDHNAYIWDISAILKEAGLDDLLLDQRDKSLLATDATPHPVRQSIMESSLVPRGFLEDTPNRAHLSVQHRPRPLSLPSRRNTLRGRFLTLFRPIHPDSDAHDAPPRPRPFHLVRNHLSGKSGGADIELHKRPPRVVEVSCRPNRYPLLRNDSARERRRPIWENPAASSSRPPNSTITQKFSGPAHTQSSSQLHAAVSTTTAPPIVANTTSNTNRHATTTNAGRWARFWHFICCTSSEYTDGHH
ncbi:hypothetical protein DFJ58DRAFT_168336 [Suillus subalutaceus]|uniref:uncharacterized protein n=1 Tax=Suillus subalutaceus TaxID=48586 RepID=UPI001B85BAF0|nr:uncharacterized protein DFJ58DRAFT_168336 [Suillus subalutaceus]KAG1865562.1 hypothetical protein DFJ58DRAFT_168336 [Suillus subalutaceus]